MARWILLMVTVLIGGLLASCATLSEDQCRAGDWRSIGVADGMEGRPANYLSNHIDACSEYGISVDQALYRDGRREGLEVYCSLDVAAAEGRAGEPYYGVCEGNIGIAFARVHRAAEQIYELEAELNSIESEISALVARVGQGGLTDQEAAQLASDIRVLERDRSSVERQIRLAESRLAAIQADERFRLIRG